MIRIALAVTDSHWIVYLHRRQLRVLEQRLQWVESCRWKAHPLIVTEVERKIAEGLSRYSDYPLSQITPDTRVWHDAEVSAEDFLDFIEWCWTTFGVVLPGQAKDYAPPAPSGVGDMWLWLRKRPAYQELTVRDLAQLVKQP
jgi:hypothetical protein